MDQIVEMQQVVIEDREEQERLEQLEELAKFASKVRGAQKALGRKVPIQHVRQERCYVHRSP